MSDSSINEPISEPCEGCGELLDVTNFGPFETAICPHCSVETHVKRNFGTYRLQQRYAVGGMSVIFVGQDTTLDRKVAIKVLNEEYCNDEVRIQAFENEARLTAQVSHPNVVQVYAVGRAFGRFYLVMELLEGQSFERIMSTRGALPENEVLEIASQVALGLQAAKNAGMIHRDVKPGNILIDEKGRARLVDFGLALITHDGHAQAEEVWATPFYVPPEALERGIEDFRSDIYAFGATLYHALAGRPPFETTSTSNSVLRKAKQTIPRLCQVAEWISPSTGEAIDRMMAYKPEDRWGSYEEIIKALDHASRHVGQSIPLPVHSETRRKRRSNGKGLAAAIIPLIAIIAGLAIWQPWKKTNSTSATPPLSDAPKQDLLGFQPTQSNDVRITKAWSSAHKQIAEGDFQKARERFQALSKNKSLSKASRSWALFEATTASFLDGQPGEARKLAAQISTHLKDAPQSPELAELHKLSKVLQRSTLPSSSDFPKSQENLSTSLGTFALALKLWEQSQWERALPLFAKVRSANFPNQPDWFQSYQSIADTYLADGQVLSSLKDLPPPKNADQASTQINKIFKALKSIQTKGRARYNLRAHQAYLTRLRKSFTSGPMPHDTTWSEILPTLSDHAKNYRFSEYAAQLKEPPEDAPSETIWALQFLQKEAVTFITTLNQSSNWSAEKKDGTLITPKSSNPQKVTLPDGSTLPWSALKAESLIKIKDQNDPPTIAFAQLMGLTEIAEEKAEELAGRDPEFLRNWKRVIIGTSQ